MKKFAKISGQYLTDGNFDKIKVTKAQVIRTAKAQNKRLGLENFDIGYLVIESENCYSVVVHSKSTSFNL